MPPSCARLECSPSPTSTHLSFLLMRPPPRSTLFPYTTLFRSVTSRRLPAVRLGHQLRRHPRSGGDRSEEHTSELQSQFHLVCRLLLEKKKKRYRNWATSSTENGRLLPMEFPARRCQPQHIHAP